MQAGLVCSVLCIVDSWLKKKEESLRRGFVRMRRKGAVIRYSFCVKKESHEKAVKCKECKGFLTVGR